MEKKWVLYMLECSDGSLYTGITDDLQRRLAAHRAGKGAKYTRGRGPLKLRYCEDCEDRSQALRRELQVKQLPRPRKLALCDGCNHPALAELSRQKENGYAILFGNLRYHR